MRRYTEGRAWISKCENPRCESPVIEAHVYGTKIRLSTKAVPLRDAEVIQKYQGIVINVWKGPTQLWATPWFRDQGAVLKGRLYIPHIHAFRN